MAEKLDFSLPQKKPQGSATGVLAVLLLVVLVVLAAANLFVDAIRAKARIYRQQGSIRGAGQGPGVASWPSGTCISRPRRPGRTIWRRLSWPVPEQAKIQFQIGTLLEKAGLYADAIEHYYRSEAAARSKSFSPISTPTSRSASRGWASSRLCAMS